MPAADLLHSLQRLVWSFVTTNHRAQFADYFAEYHRRWIVARHHDAIQQVALREDANQTPRLIEDADCPDSPLGHELGRLEHAGRSEQRIRLAIADYVLDQNHVRASFQVGRNIGRFSWRKRPHL